MNPHGRQQHHTADAEPVSAAKASREMRTGEACRQDGEGYALGGHLFSLAQPSSASKMPSMVEGLRGGRISAARAWRRVRVWLSKITSPVAPSTS